MESKLLNRVRGTGVGTHRSSKIYNVNTKQPMERIPPPQYHYTTNFKELEERYYNREWIGIIDHYLIMDEDTDNMTLDELLSNIVPRYIQGEAVDADGYVLSGISTGHILYITDEWIYTISGSLYKLMNKYIYK